MANRLLKATKLSMSAPTLAFEVARNSRRPFEAVNERCGAVVLYPQRAVLIELEENVSLKTCARASPEAARKNAAMASDSDRRTLGPMP
jgi:hypothetical protein